MNDNKNSLEIIQLIPKLTQALYHDGLLYFSGEPTLSTEERKITLKNDVNILKEYISNLEKIIN